MARQQRFRVSRVANEVEFQALELIRQAENYNNVLSGYAQRVQRHSLLQQARRYASAVRSAARARA